MTTEMTTSQNSEGYITHVAYLLVGVETIIVTVLE